jgi:hypothetical protein
MEHRGPAGGNVWTYSSGPIRGDEAPGTSGSASSADLSSLGQSFLHLYEQSVLYDCTFKVGFQESGFKVCASSEISRVSLDLISEGFDNLQLFKCHRAILAACSPVFLKTFSANFKEARMQPDEPILLDRVTSRSF